jgi:Cu2+-containing amine oxidase
VGYGRPVGGLITFVDLEKMEVVEVIDDPVDVYSTPGSLSEVLRQSVKGGQPS